MIAPIVTRGRSSHGAILRSVKRHKREPRVVARCQVRFERLERVVEAESEDLSRRGLFVRTDELLPAGAVTELHVILPDGARFDVLARVAHLLAPSAARALGRHVGMGFEFLDTDPGGVDALATYLDDLIEELTPPPTTVPSTVVAYVVERSRPLRERIAAALERAGWQVEVLVDGAEAYRACAGRPPDLVVAATALDGMDGLTLVRSLSIHPRLSRVPVILTSDDTSDLTRLDAFRLGVRDFITRPFVDEELVLRAHRVALDMPRGTAETAMVRGDLAEISLSTLLSLFEFERKSGILVVLSRHHAARLFLAGGRVVKVDAGDGARPPLACLLTVLDWTIGHFEFTSCEVMGIDELGMATSHVLLEHARVNDEASRG